MFVVVLFLRRGYVELSEIFPATANQMVKSHSIGALDTNDARGMEHPCEHPLADITHNVNNQIILTSQAQGLSDKAQEVPAFFTAERHGRGVDVLDGGIHLEDGRELWLAEHVDGVRARRRELVDEVAHDDGVAKGARAEHEHLLRLTAGRALGRGRGSAGTCCGRRRVVTWLR